LELRDLVTKFITELRDRKFAPKIADNMSKHKIIIPTIEEFKKIEHIGAYSHFNERLSQRYGLEISIEEYDALKCIPFEVIKKEKHKLIGVMQIKGVTVVAVREKDRRRKFVTALPYKCINSKSENKVLEN
jgi:hypothetical protein